MAGARKDEDVSPLGDAPGAGSAALPAVPDRKSGFIDGDATLMPGQYPASLFGVPLPQASSPGTGGALSGGDFGGAADPTTEPGQYPPTEPVSGVKLDVGGAGTFQPDPKAGVQPGDGSGTAKTLDITGVDLMANTTHEVSATVDGTGDWTAAQGYYPDDEPITGVALPHVLGAARGDYQPAGGSVVHPPQPNNMNIQAGAWAPQPVGAGEAQITAAPHPNNMSGTPRGGQA